MAPARLKCNTICALWGEQSSTVVKCFRYVYVLMQMRMCTWACMYKCATSWSVTMGKVIFKVEFRTHICCQMTVVYRRLFAFFEGFYNVKCLFSIKYTRIVASWCYGCVKSAGPFIWLVVCNVMLANYVFYGIELGCYASNKADPGVTAKFDDNKCFLCPKRRLTCIYTSFLCAV